MAGEARGFDRLRHWRIIYSAAMTRDAIMAELFEIEGLLQDDRLTTTTAMHCTALNKLCCKKGIDALGSRVRSR
jgi:hypothetical protein